MTSYFQYGSHDVRPPLATAYATASAGCPLACQLLDFLEDFYAQLLSLARHDGAQHWKSRIRKLRENVEKFHNKPLWDAISVQLCCERFSLRLSDVTGSMFSVRTIDSFGSLKSKGVYG